MGLGAGTSCLQASRPAPPAPPAGARPSRSTTSPFLLASLLPDRLIMRTPPGSSSSLPVSRNALVGVVGAQGAARQPRSQAWPCAQKSSRQPLGRGNGSWLLATGRLDEPL